MPRSPRILDALKASRPMKMSRRPPEPRIWGQTRLGRVQEPQLVTKSKTLKNPIMRQNRQVFGGFPRHRILLSAFQNGLLLQLLRR